MEKKKSIRKKDKSKELSSDSPYMLPDGSLLDLSTIDFGEDRYTEKEKLFIFWYTFPEGGTFHNATGSVRKAGYNTYQRGWDIRTKPKIQKGIQQVENKFLKVRLEEAFTKIVEKRINRIDFDVADFYKVEKIKKGKKTIKYTTIKPLDELTPEQRACIDGLDFTGPRGIENYKLPDRRTEENSLMQLYEKLTDNKSGNGGTFEIEATADVIKNNLQLKTSLIVKNSEIAASSELKDNSEYEIVEED